MGTRRRNQSLLSRFDIQIARRVRIKRVDQKAVCKIISTILNIFIPRRDVFLYPSAGTTIVSSTMFHFNCFRVSHYFLLSRMPLGLIIIF
jgi:hypothetical protein